LKGRIMLVVNFHLIEGGMLIPMEVILVECRDKCILVGISLFMNRLCEQ